MSPVFAGLLQGEDDCEGGNADDGEGDAKGGKDGGAHAHAAAAAAVLLLGLDLAPEVHGGKGPLRTAFKQLSCQM